MIGSEFLSFTGTDPTKNAMGFEEGPIKGTEYSNLINQKYKCFLTKD